MAVLVSEKFTISIDFSSLFLIALVATKASLSYIIAIRLLL